MNDPNKSPIILALETSTDGCSVAIAKNQEIVSHFEVAKQLHAKILLGMLDLVCAKAGVSLQEVDLFAYGMGPGSFTGLRIAASAVQGLAFASSKPVMGISSLQALAQQFLTEYGLPQDTKIKYIPCLDARMQEVYWGVYSIDPNGIMLSDQVDGLSNPHTICLDKNQIYVTFGTGTTTYYDVLHSHNPNLQLVENLMYPRAHEVAKLALLRMQNGETGSDSALATPAYIRNNVAQVGKKNPD